MPRPPVDKRLQHIETTLDGIMDKLCEMSPCEPEISEENTEESTED